MSKKTKTASKSATKSAPASKSEKKSSLSNQTTWIIIIVAVLVVVVLLSFIGKGERKAVQSGTSSTLPLAPVVSPLPSPSDAPQNIVTGNPSGVDQTGSNQPGWNLSFNGNTAFGLSVNAGVNDRGELYIDPTFHSNIFNFLRRNASDSAASNN